MVQRKNPSAPGEAHAQIGLAGPESLGGRGALHEPAGARRFDELVAERRIELSERGHEDRRLRSVRAVLQRRLRLAQIDLGTVRRVRVELHGEGHVFPFAGHAHASAPDREPVLVHGRAALEELVLRILVRLVLRLEVAADGDPFGRKDPGPERLAAQRQDSRRRALIAPGRRGRLSLTPNRPPPRLARCGPRPEGR